MSLKTNSMFLPHLQTLRIPTRLLLLSCPIVFLRSPCNCLSLLLLFQRIFFMFSPQILFSFCLCYFSCFLPSLWVFFLFHLVPPTPCHPFTDYCLTCLSQRHPSLNSFFFSISLLNIFSGVFFFFSFKFFFIFFLFPFRHALIRVSCFLIVLQHSFTKFIRNLRFQSCLGFFFLVNLLLFGVSQIVTDAFS